MLVNLRLQGRRTHPSSINCLSKHVLMKYRYRVRNLTLFHNILQLLTGGERFTNHPWLQHRSSITLTHLSALLSITLRGESACWRHQQDWILTWSELRWDH